MFFYFISTDLGTNSLDTADVLLNKKVNKQKNKYTAMMDQSIREMIFVYVPFN